MYDELVKRLRELASIPVHCENVAEKEPCVSGMGSCEDCWLDWLRQEVHHETDQS
jgi:hypothetical protein